MPRCSLRPRWILTASPRSPSGLEQINPSPKYYQSEAEAYYTLGKCHPFPLRGSALVNSDRPPGLRMCYVTVKTRGPRFPGLRQGGSVRLTGSRETPQDAALRPPPSKKVGTLLYKAAAIWFGRWRSSTARKDIGQKLEEFSGVCVGGLGLCGVFLGGGICFGFCHRRCFSACPEQIIYVTKVGKQGCGG